MNSITTPVLLDLPNYVTPQTGAPDMMNGPFFQTLRSVQQLYITKYTIFTCKYGHA